jgi:hypothetical protein
MPRTYTSLIFALATLAAAACADEPVRPVRTPHEAERTIARTIDGRAVSLRYDGRTATVSVDGRPTMRVRFDGELRHVTAFFADGRTFERTYTRRELEAAARSVQRPSLDLSDGEYAVSGDDGGLKCLKEWMAYAGATLVAVVTCAETGPNPICAAAVAAAANTLEAAVQCETKGTTTI